MRVICTKRGGGDTPIIIKLEKQMDQVYLLMKEHDEKILYGLFGTLCFIVVLGYPILLH